jgi:hypothetical protein
MALPWLRIIDSVLGVGDIVRLIKGRPPLDERAERDQLALEARGAGGLETRLASVVVAALKEAFDRDHQRLELERQQMEAERQRSERALRLELVRQAGDREIGRLRLLAAVAVAAWLGTLLFATRLVGGTPGARMALGAGWLLLLAALAAAFAAQSQVARALGRIDERAVPNDITASGAGAAAPWLVVAGLAAIAVGVLLA